MSALTRPQAEALAFIKAWLATHDYAPSVREIMVGLGAKSTSQVHRLVVALEQKGRLRRTPYRIRAIELVERAPTVLIPLYKLWEIPLLPRPVTLFTEAGR